MSQDQGQGFSLTTPDQIAMFQLLRCRSGLAIEIHTGMKCSQGSMLSYLQRMTVREDGEPITTKRTKRGAYKDLNALCVELGANDLPLRVTTHNPKGNA